MKRVVTRQERNVTPSGKGIGSEFVLLTDLGAAISRIVLPPIRAVSMVVNGALTAASATIATLGSTTLTATTANATTLNVSGAESTSVSSATSAFPMVALTSTVDNWVVGGADGTNGVILPAVTAGRRIYIKNTDNAVLKIAPYGTNAINALGAGNVLDMAAYSSAIFVGVSTSQWYTCPTVPS